MFNQKLKAFLKNIGLFNELEPSSASQDVINEYVSNVFFLRKLSNNFHYVLCSFLNLNQLIVLKSERAQNCSTVRCSFFELFSHLKLDDHVLESRVRAERVFISIFSELHGRC